MAEQKTYTLRRVPATQVDQLLKEYAIDNPARVTKIDNHDGTFDLEIVFRPPVRS
jgi:hypothetical protein